MSSNESNNIESEHKVVSSEVIQVDSTDSKVINVHVYRKTTKLIDWVWLFIVMYIIFGAPWDNVSLFQLIKEYLSNTLLK